jgi:hypothetical protein
MTLLDKGNEEVTIYPETTRLDADGNLITYADRNNPIETTAVIQVAASSGTSARRAEQDNEGFEGEANYRVRFPRSLDHIPGAQAQLLWNNQVWSFVGDVKRYNGGPRTAHLDYVIRRA